VVLDESQAAALDEQSGTSVSRIGTPRGAASGDGWGMTATGAEYDDSGGASRFFYCAKAPKRERPTYDTYGCICDHSREQHGAGTLCLVANCWCVGFAVDRSTIKTNSHATVKPLTLMRWLVRLVTPPGGVCLDPFAGSGTTVEAALLEGFRVIGIEREADYLPMIQQRIVRCLNS
jgi:site-specific DNA-methyltransferase (adenine-specific)